MHRHTGGFYPDSPNPRKSAQLPGIPKHQKNTGPEKSDCRAPQPEVSREIGPSQQFRQFCTILLHINRVIKNTFDSEAHFGEQEKVCMYMCGVGVYKSSLISFSTRIIHKLSKHFDVHCFI